MLTLTWLRSHRASDWIFGSSRHSFCSFIEKSFTFQEKHFSLCWTVRNMKQRLNISVQNNLKSELKLFTNSWTRRQAALMFLQNSSLRCFQLCSDPFELHGGIKQEHVDQLDLNRCGTKMTTRQNQTVKLEFWSFYDLILKLNII